MSGVAIVVKGSKYSLIGNLVGAEGFEPPTYSV
jgi:hypothetical protein